MFCPSCGAEVAPDLQFCPVCGAQQPQANLGGGAPPPIAGAVQPVWAPQLQPGDVQMGKWIGEGWSTVTSDMGTFILITIVSLIVGSAVPIVLQGAMHSGFYLACMKKMKRGRADISDLFKGLNYFVPALVAAILTSIFCFAGFLFCIIPGIVIAAMYMFTYLFIVDKKLDYWPAMQASHAVVKQNYVGFTLFLVVLGLINILGFLCLLVGLLITIPASMVAITAAYRDLVGFEPNSDL